MSDNDLLFKSATALAAMVRSGEISSRELTELSLRRIEQLDPDLGAFIAVDGERALASADAVKPGDQRPFAGVPTAIKDIGPFLAGYPYTAGSNLFGDFTPDSDGSVVRRIKDAGFVIVGKTKTPEMGILPVTEPDRYGPARNPYNRDHTPGGSSGGAAAAVASGMLPVAHGNDGGGSLRIPAACCGLIGFKPSRDRVSGAPLLAEQPLTTDMMLTRTVTDSAAALDFLAGYELGDACWAPPPSRSFSESAQSDPGRLRIGFTNTPQLDMPVDPLHARQVEDVAQLLAGLGHDVDPVDPPWQNPEMMLMFTKIFGGWVSTLTNFAGMVSGKGVTEETVEPLTWAMWELAQSVGALEWLQINAAAQMFTRSIITALDAYDVVLTPTLNQRPVRIGEIDSSKGMEAFGAAAAFTSFTAGINLSGQPAVSLPTGVADDGLPLAVQLIGRPADEATLFSIAAQIEQAKPWADLRPTAIVGE